jgi:hypothetical protein
MLASPMWLIAIFFVPLLVVLLTSPMHLYPWTDSELVTQDHLLHGKQPYLNVPFFLIRAAGFFAIWIGFATYYVRTSIGQDQGLGGESASVRMRKLSAPFMLIFAVTVSFAGIDWLMSLDPHWFSTMFGVYVFSGMVVTALAAIAIATVLLRNAGVLPTSVVTDHHMYNFGVLIFAFVCFWAYIAFSQYMLIWYANLPEESYYMAERMQGSWLGISIALAVVRFGIPFLVLLPRPAKSNPTVLLWVSALMLVGQLLDLYWVIMPERPDGTAGFGWQELGPLLLMLGVLIVFLARFLGKYAPMPVGDPLLQTSKEFRL